MYIDMYTSPSLPPIQIRINVPSYCDRVLWKSYPGTNISNTSYGNWPLDFELWTLDFGLWTLNFGLWTLDSINLCVSASRDIATCTSHALTVCHFVLLPWFQDVLRTSWPVATPQCLPHSRLEEWNSMPRKQVCIVGRNNEGEGEGEEGEGRGEVVRKKVRRVRVRWNILARSNCAWLFNSLNVHLSLFLSFTPLLLVPYFPSSTIVSRFYFLLSSLLTLHSQSCSLVRRNKLFHHCWQLQS